MQCKDRLSFLSADTLQGTAHEILSISGNEDKKDKFNEYIVSTTSHRRSYLSEGVIELKDEATRRQH